MLCFWRRAARKAAEQKIEIGIGKQNNGLAEQLAAHQSPPVRQFTDSRTHHEHQAAKSCGSAELSTEGRKMLMEIDSKSRFGGIALTAAAVALCSNAVTAEEKTATFPLRPAEPTLVECRDALAQGNVLLHADGEFTVFHGALLYVIRLTEDSMICRAWRPVN